MDNPDSILCSFIENSIGLKGVEHCIVFFFSDGPIAVGRMYINSISKLLRIGGQHNPTMVNPSLADLDCDSDLEDETSGKLGTNSKVLYYLNYLFTLFYTDFIFQYLKILDRVGTHNFLITFFFEKNR